ncbi:hypothetical protein E1B28_010493 [Marasmius oreades]|nr:uncharacterized protein E1B28_010493 [Marasmius oreades]KAG7091462.1 hypothetical protein E1B28_010493 [Marasmius oreades]
MSVLPLVSKRPVRRDWYRRIIGILILGVVLGFVLYHGGSELQRYRVVSFNPPETDTSYVDPSSSPALNFSLESSHSVSTADPTTTSSPPKPTTVDNNHVTYAILPPLDQEEIETTRESHLGRIDEVIAGEIENFRNWNVKQLEALKKYWLEVENAQPKVVLSTYGYVPCAMTVCSTTGEVIWLESLINSFRENNQFLLYTEYENLGKMYKKYGDVVTHVWSTDNHVIWCFNDTISCIQSTENPDGIPPWKLFTFTFWGSPRGWQNFLAPPEPWSFNPLGGEWNLVPYRMPDQHFYLGYHYTGCQDLPFIPHSERKDQVLILAKRSEYFHRWTFLEPSVWPVIKNKTGYNLISVSNSEEGYPVPEALTLIGPMERHAYDVLLGSAKALLGIGRPRVSPSPFASLCRGVPVILPYKGTKCPAQPGDSTWCGDHQHGPAADIGPPYVYTVNSEGPIDDIVETIMTAVNTPIEP